MSSLSITEKRQQEIAFTDKLYAADSRLVVKKGSPVTPDLATLKGKRVGVLQGTTQETYGNEHWAPKGIEIVSYQGQDNIYSDLTAGRIDAAFQDEVAASEGFLKQPIGKDYQFGGPSIKDEKLFGVGTGMGLRKEDNELREALNKAFAEMRKDGTYDKLAKNISILTYTANNSRLAIACVSRAMVNDRQGRQHAVWVFTGYFAGCARHLELALSSVVLAVLIGLAALAQSYRATVHWRWCLKAIPL